MRIAIVSYWCVPYTGGVSTYVLALRKGLQDRGHEVDILSHDGTGTNYHNMDKNVWLNKEFVLRPIRDQIARQYNDKVGGYDPWLAAMKAERLAFRQALSVFTLNNYDIIHAQDVISAICVSEVKPAGTPLVVTLHGRLAAEWEYQGAIANGSASWQWAHELDRFGSTVGDRVIMPSQWLLKRYDSFRKANEQTDIVPYGMDTIAFLRAAAIPSANSGKEGGKLIVCPARLDPVKGHHVLLQALAALASHRSDWICWLVGDGPLRGHLEQLAIQFGLQNRVRFLGHRNDMPALLKEADFVVVPSIHDNTPFVVMEAQVSGKAIIASEVGGIPEMIADGENGLLFPPSRADLLHAAINRLLDDDSLRIRLANQARLDGLRKWPINLMTGRTVALYERTLLAAQGGNR
ncbi:glycosyltransferase family 4 protein [Paenibacillus sp. NPDC058071]|uniref:glycosyltransferase family 4 protein n=1 Tax=Paenibacillus sp. NPDC058071 TaxID=3346326 RepID=UPI0036DAFB90